MNLKKFKKRMKERNLNIAVVGFGYIGTIIGAVLSERGYNVIGIDSNLDIVNSINYGRTVIPEPGLSDLVLKNFKSGRLKATSDYSHITETDLIIITVGTPLSSDFRPDISQIELVTKQILQYLKNDINIILKSTIPPGTTTNVVKPLLDDAGINYTLAFCPERLAEGNAISEFCSIPIVVGGIDHRSTNLASAFWQMALNVDTIKVKNTLTAELIKLADNLWIDLNISIANEIAMLCDNIGLDSLEVIQGANSLPKGEKFVNILHPSIGVGGYCLTKDPWFIYNLGKNYGLDLRTPKTSRFVNDSMPKYSYSVILKELNKLGKSISTSKVAVLGISMKSDTGDCRFTPTKELIELLHDSKCDLTFYDPLVDPKDVDFLNGKGLSNSVEEAIKDCDCIAFLTGHKEFKELDIGKISKIVKPNSIIFDGRMYFSNDEILKIKENGLKYKGIGRC